MQDESAAEFRKSFGPECGGHPYRMRASHETANTLRVLEAMGAICALRSLPSGFRAVAEFEFQLPGGAEQVTDVLEMLVQNQHCVSYFARSPLPTLG